MDSQKHKREIRYSGDDGQPWEPQEAADRLVLETKPRAGSMARPAGKAAYSSLDSIFGQSLNWYFSSLAWPLFILLFLEIGLRVMQNRYFGAISENVLDGILNVLRLALFGYFTVASRKQYKATARQIMVGAVLMGFLAGLGLGLFLLFWSFNLLSVLNLIGLPLLLAAYGWLISWLLIKVLKYN